MTLLLERPERDEEAYVVSRTVFRPVNDVQAKAYECRRLQRETEARREFYRSWNLRMNDATWVCRQQGTMK